MANIKNEKKSTNKLIAAIAFAILTVVFGLLIIVPVRYYRNSEKTPDGLISVTYTYQSNKQYGGKNKRYEITVKEASKPLRVQGVYISAVNKQNLSALKSGDTVHCYVMASKNEDYAYDLVEMYRGQTPIMTLQEFNSAGRKNAIIGLVILPIITVAFLVGAIYNFSIYAKRK